MPQIRAFGLLCLFFLVGCGGPSSAVGGGSEALADLWTGFTASGGTSGDCEGRFSTYRTFGVRYLACQAAEAMPLGQIVGRAPVRPFLSGPHDATAQGVAISFEPGREYGHYNPDFVRWVTGAAVTTSPVARRLAQPVYDAHVAQSARIFWLAYQGLAAEGFPKTLPSGALSEYAAFLNGGPVTEAIQGYGGGDAIQIYTLIDAMPPLAPEGEVINVGLDVGGTERPMTFDDFEISESASTALAFWVRRAADGTEDEWQDGLESLLEAYDASWLASHR